jgi:hypothetical protein
MARDLRPLDDWVLKTEWPYLPCPSCADGALSPDDDGLKTVNSGESIRYRDHEDWEPEWLMGRFHGVLKCHRPDCQETVVIAGDYKVDTVEGQGNDWQGQAWGDYLRLRFARPPLRLLAAPPGTPQPVTEAIDSASEVLWSDPGAAANRLRVGIEQLLSDRRVPKTAPKTKGGRRRLTTHERIEKFTITQPTAGSFLEAVKWIGNAGSHETVLTAKDVLDGAELLEHALHLLYDKRDQKLERRARQINRRKGLPRKAVKK